MRVANHFMRFLQITQKLSAIRHVLKRVSKSAKTVFVSQVSKQFPMRSTRQEPPKHFSSCLEGRGKLA
jgi:hypothetical protein